MMETDSNGFLTLESMMKLQPTLDQIAGMDSQITTLGHRRHMLRYQLAELLCPHKVGDIVTIEGYAYRGQKGKVLVVASPPYGELGYRVEVAVLKNDGTPGKHRTDWYRCLYQAPDSHHMRIS